MLQLQYLDTVYIHLNQGWREGEVLAVIKDRALVEYTMPAGKTFMIFVNNPCEGFDHNPASFEGQQLRKIDGWIRKKFHWGWYKSVSYNALSKKWLKEITKNGLSWYGGHTSNHEYYREHNPITKKWDTKHRLLLTPQQRLDGQKPDQYMIYPKT